MDLRRFPASKPPKTTVQAIDELGDRLERAYVIWGVLGALVGALLAAGALVAAIIVRRVRW